MGSSLWLQHINANLWAPLLFSLLCQYGNQRLKLNVSFWLVMHNKMLKADNVLKRNWDCNQFCSLCLCIVETVDHLLTKCNLTELVWNSVAARLGLSNYDSLNYSGGPKNWMVKIMSTDSPLENKRNLGIMFTVWNRPHSIFVFVRKSAPETLVSWRSVP
jgi:hypothetical protein